MLLESEPGGHSEIIGEADVCTFVDAFGLQGLSTYGFVETFQ